MIVTGLPQVIADAIQATPYLMEGAVTLCWHLPTRRAVWTSNEPPALPPEGYQRTPGTMVFILRGDHWERYA